MADYANPGVLVSTEWVSQNLANPSVRIVEVDVDTKAYDEGHVPGAIAWSWNTQLCDTVRRDSIPKPKFEALMASSGIANGTTVVLFGDNNNWFAAWALWQLQIYGHRDVRLMNGGRKKWLAENRELSREAPSIGSASYHAKEPDYSIRSFLPQVQQSTTLGTVDLVDVRSPAEFSGEILAPPGLPETCQRGGHIPGARNIPWEETCNEDGTFKSADELRALYERAGITGLRPTIAYCRIGERSSHTWFVLTHLLGFANVTNYDGSWTEWGNLVGAPSGAAAAGLARRRRRRRWLAGKRVSMKAEDYSSRTLEIEGWPVRLTSYRFGAEYYCTADNIDPGAAIARTTGTTREEVEDRALERAAQMLGRTLRRTAG